MDNYTDYVFRGFPPSLLAVIPRLFPGVTSHAFYEVLEF
jgi:hypothetical protein